MVADILFPYGSCKSSSCKPLTYIMPTLDLRCSSPKPTFYQPPSLPCNSPPQQPHALPRNHMHIPHVLEPLRQGQMSLKSSKAGGTSTSLLGACAEWFWERSSLAPVNGPEGPCTQYLRFQSPNTMNSMVFGTQSLKC